MIEGGEIHKIVGKEEGQDCKIVNKCSVGVPGATRDHVWPARGRVTRFVFITVIRFVFIIVISGRYDCCAVYMAHVGRQPSSRVSLRRNQLLLSCAFGYALLTLKDFVIKLQKWHLLALLAR